MSNLSNSLAFLQKVRDAGHNEVIVAFSGGKDSIVTLDLCSKVFDRVHAFFLYIVKGLEVEETPLRRAERRYGLDIHRLPRPELGKILAQGAYTTRMIRFRRSLTTLDIHRHIRKKTGARFIAMGHRMDESLQRRGMINSTCKADGEKRASEGVDRKNGKIYPVFNWNARSVYAYVRRENLSNLVIDTGEIDTGGIGLGAKSLKRLKERYPADYRRMLDVMPFLETKIMRDEICNSKSKQNRELYTAGS